MFIEEKIHQDEIDVGRAEDLRGKKFGRLTVLYRVKGKKETMWKCQCDCGNSKIVSTSHLKTNHTISCGCLKKSLNLEGQIFTYLTVIKDSGKRTKNGTKIWECKCKCGKTHYAATSHLKDGTVKSCGCLITEKNQNNLTGKQFGLLTVIEDSEQRKNRNTVWKCMCQCGKIHYVTANNLLNGSTQSCGCLNISHAELNISRLLEQNQFKYIKQKTFDNCRNPQSNAKFRFDFFVENKYIIEYDGQQHFKYTNTGWNTQKNYLKTHKYDLIKNAYCFKNNIPIIRIPSGAKYELSDLVLETTRFLLTPENEEEYYKLIP